MDDTWILGRLGHQTLGGRYEYEVASGRPVIFVQDKAALLAPFSGYDDSNRLLWTHTLLAWEVILASYKLQHLFCPSFLRRGISYCLGIAWEHCWGRSLPPREWEGNGWLDGYRESGHVLCA